MKICRGCGAEKPDSEFYGINRVCRECYLERGRIYRERRKQQRDERLKSILLEEEEIKPNKNAWIIKLLNLYGNCYIRKMRNIPELEQMLGAKINVKVIADGFVLEKIK